MAPKAPTEIAGVAELIEERIPAATAVMPVTGAQANKGITGKTAVSSF